MTTLASYSRVFLIALCAVVLGLVRPVGARADEVTQYEAFKKALPMEFYIARGGPNACGTGCDRRIAAEGHIVRDSLGVDGRIEEGSTARFVRLLSQLGGRKLPIFFHSFGGDTIEALAFGRALRVWDMTAGVAVTVPANCSAAENGEDCR